MENFTNLSNRIKQLIEYKGISINKFSTLVGASNSYFNKILRDNNSIGSDRLEKILRTFPEINPIWLLMGEGTMLKSEAPATPVQEVTPTNNDKYTNSLEKQITQLEEINALQKEKIKDLERRLAFAEVKDKEEMSLKIKTQRKEAKEKDEIIFTQNEEINALKSRYLPPDEPLQPSKRL